MAIRFGAAETERLHLEPWGVPAHTEALVELNLDAEVTRFLGGPATREHSEMGARRIAQHWEEHGFGLWAPVVKDTGQVIGFTGICHPSWHPDFADQVEVGWRLSRDAWGHGYATEAARRALQYGWEGGLEEILAFVDPGNERSIAVTQRLGLEPAGETTDPRHGNPILLFSVKRLG
jgi:RimJ/RimL family protein N-acetyltransferase